MVGAPPVVNGHKKTGAEDDAGSEDRPNRRRERFGNRRRLSYMLLSDMELLLIELPLMVLPDIVLPDMVLPAIEPPDMELELVLLLDIEFEDIPLSDVVVLSLLLLPQADRPMDNKAAAVTRINFFIFDAFLETVILMYALSSLRVDSQYYCRCRDRPIAEQ